MGAVHRFRRAFHRLAPSWLTGGPVPSPVGTAPLDAPEAERVWFSLFLMLDMYAERARQGLLARYPEATRSASGATYTPPDDALPPIGRDRQIVRGINEPRATYALRLKRWLDTHAKRGNPFALCSELAAYCGQPLRIRTVDRRGNWFTIESDGTRSYVLDSGNWNWDGAPASPRWARGWVILYPPATLWTVGPVIGDPELWGGAIGTPGYTIGCTATPDQARSIQSIVRDWKPAGTKCEWIVVAFDDASFDPGAPEPDGLWGPWSKTVAGVQVPSRLDTARYWTGAA